jgi:23S rRNA maturation-related 3'-5' exoribonuclease YhaM
MTETDLSDPPLTPAEAERRMPSLALIEDDDIRAETRRLTQFAPAYFWTRPGSTAGYHNAHDRGLWAHTLKLSTVIERLAGSFTERGLLRGSVDVDRAHAAAILHDQRKAGKDGEETQSDHDLRMGELVRQESDLDETVSRAIEEHMGPWYDGPEPSSALAELVHSADMMASAENVDIALPGPVPEELEEHGYDAAAGLD